MNLDELPKRNADAFKQAIELQNIKIAELHDIVLRQQNTLIDMSNKIGSLEQQLLTYKVRSSGHGPSVRE